MASLQNCIVKNLPSHTKKSLILISNKGLNWWPSLFSCQLKKPLHLHLFSNLAPWTDEIMSKIFFRFTISFRSDQNCFDLVWMTINLFKDRSNKTICFKLELRETKAFTEHLCYFFVILYWNRFHRSFHNLEHWIQWEWFELLLLSFSHYEKTKLSNLSSLSCNGLILI